MTRLYFGGRADDLGGPAADYAPVDVSGGDAALDPPAQALYVETGGAVRFAPVKPDAPDRTVTVPDGGFILCRVSAVRQTGTTASGIHALLLD